MIGDDPPSADAVAAAFIESFGRYARSLDGGWVRQLPEGVTAVVSGVPAATLNGVWSAGAGCDVESLQAAVELVAQNGLPFCLQVRPRDEHVAARVARGQTMVVAPPIPLMALAGPPAAPAVDTELAIRPLEPREAAMHVQVAARAFGATAELFGLAVTETSLRSPGVRAYLGDRAGRPVATAIAATHAGRVGLYNVATLPDARGRGYGAAITARAITDGLHAGATWSWLQSAPEAVPLYERLGFRLLEHWPCWLADR